MEIAKTTDYGKQNACELTRDIQFKLSELRTYIHIHLDKNSPEYASYFDGIFDTLKNLSKDCMDTRINLKEHKT